MVSWGEGPEGRKTSGVLQGGQNLGFGGMSSRGELKARLPQLSCLRRLPGGTAGRGLKAGMGSSGQGAAYAAPQGRRGGAHPRGLAPIARRRTTCRVPAFTPSPPPAAAPTRLWRTSPLRRPAAMWGEGHAGPAPAPSPTPSLPSRAYAVETRQEAAWPPRGGLGPAAVPPGTAPSVLAGVGVVCSWGTWGWGGSVCTPRCLEGAAYELISKRPGMKRFGGGASCRPWWWWRRRPREATSGTKLAQRQNCRTRLEWVAFASGGAQSWEVPEVFARGGFPVGENQEL